MEFVNTSTKYEHKEKGGVYKIKELCPIKHPDNDDWIPGVVYQSVLDGRIFVRSLISFLANFEDYNERKHNTNNYNKEQII